MPRYLIERSFPEGLSIPMNDEGRKAHMFTGIITDVGRVVAAEERGDLRLRIACGYDMAGVDLGASIACSGVCLTVVDKGEDWFAVDVSGETRPERIRVPQGKPPGLGEVLDQDSELLPVVQKGLRSRGFRGPLWSEQEQRVRHFHRELDRYINREK